MGGLCPVNGTTQEGHRADKACSRVEEVVGALQGGATAVKQGGDCGLDHASQTARPAEGLLSAQHMAVVGPADCVLAGATSEHVPTGSLCHVPAQPWGSGVGAPDGAPWQRIGPQ